jgi:large subunit ribosomal protein L16
MQYIPKKFKFKKQQKGRNFNKIAPVLGLQKLHFGSAGLCAQANGRLTSKHLETLKQIITKFIKRSGRLKINVFPHTSVSKKPLEIRMGKGKGAVAHWVAKVQPGVVICEIELKNIVLGKMALRAAQQRLPMHTKLILF